MFRRERRAREGVQYAVWPLFVVVLALSREGTSAWSLNALPQVGAGAVSGGWTVTATDTRPRVVSLETAWQLVFHSPVFSTSICGQPRYVRVN